MFIGDLPEPKASAAMADRVSLVTVMMMMLMLMVIHDDDDDDDDDDDNYDDGGDYDDSNNDHHHDDGDDEDGDDDDHDDVGGDGDDCVDDVGGDDNDHGSDNANGDDDGNDDYNDNGPVHICSRYTYPGNCSRNKFSVHEQYVQSVQYDLLCMHCAMCEVILTCTLRADSSLRAKPRPVRTSSQFHIVQTTLRRRTNGAICSENMVRPCSSWNCSSGNTTL